MLNNLSILRVNPYQTRSDLKALHFGDNKKDTPSGKIVREFNKEMERSHIYFTLEPTPWEKREIENLDYSKLTPKKAIEFQTRRLKIFTARAHNLAYRDGLTRINNRQSYDIDRRNYFIKACNSDEHETPSLGSDSRDYFIEACKKQEPLSLIFIDLDKFKDYNTKFGHDGGDIALKEYARITKKVLEKNFIRLGKQGKAYRYGGEELVTLLRNTDYKTAGKIAEKIRAQIETESIELHKNGKLEKPLTVSIGYSTFMPEAEMLNIEEIIQQNNEETPQNKKKKSRKIFIPLENLQKTANRAMLAAKDAGRNRVMGAKELEAPEQKS